eukprot:TRINITY_DN34865_c0_g1_i1.p1 TRINITY_DN34865_c0_g1~~TRINITY_DN34865_c0_g1_i1.p1  ORF type:complete len:408 (-),score=12.85 TRINITY_DN34865_c0_g1_i1:210-1307(-)
MAGQHQIWRYDVASGRCTVFSGSGYERNQNGRFASDTAYAQPSGLSLSLDGREAYVADSESSAVRAVNLGTGGSRLLAGGDANFAENLFKFGDRDGSASRALLQHPLAVLTLSDGRVAIADSYNHKIKLLDPSRGSVTTVAGTGSAGYRDGEGKEAQFSEPGGLAHGPNGTILVADTNNSLVRVLDLSSSPPLVSTLDLSSVPPPLAASSPSGPKRRLRRRQRADEEVVETRGLEGGVGEVNLRLSIPSDYHFTQGATSKFSVELPDMSPVTVEPDSGALTLKGTEALATLKFASSDASAADGQTIAQIHCKIFYCQQDDLCLYKAVNFRVPFTMPSSDGGQSLDIDFAITPAAPTNRDLRVPAS